MKKFFRTVAALAAMLPFAVSAQQFTQGIPDHITEIRVEGHARLTVSEGAEASIASSTDERVATARGSRLIFGDNASVEISLPAGRSMSFVADDRSEIIFRGSFGQRQQFSLFTNDYSLAAFSGSLADTLLATDLKLRADDHSKISSEIVISSLNCDLEANDYASINLACKAKNYVSGATVHTETLAINNDNAAIDFNVCSGDTVTPYDAVVPVKVGSVATRKPSFWRRRGVALDFAWGFHNWGDGAFTGFSGVDGAAGVRTSFNHVHLSLSLPLVGTRHTGLYIGLGLDWDNYKFTTPEVLFDPATASFSQGMEQNCSSSLWTRYVVVPVTFRIDLWHDWHLSFAALPGIHWSGSHTGMRREYEYDKRDELHKDYSVNRFINPYKFDVRVTASYEGFGLFFQVPTMSTMKGEVEDLYPMKFGVQLTLD